MARTPPSLLHGSRLSDYLSFGVIARIYPREAVQEALERTGRGSVYRRSLSAEVMADCVIAMALFRPVSTWEVLRCLLEELRWVSPELLLRVSGKSSISRTTCATRCGAVQGVAGSLRVAAGGVLDAGGVVPELAPKWPLMA